VTDFDSYKIATFLRRVASRERDLVTDKLLHLSVSKGPTFWPGSGFGKPSGLLLIMQQTFNSDGGGIEQIPPRAETFDPGSQTRFQINHFARVNRLLVASLVSCRQSRNGDFFSSGQSATRGEEQPAGTIDLED